jgi:hypothetical protein
MPVKSSGGMDDLWIRTYIRSENWAPQTKGFCIDGRTGYAEFTNVFVNGKIQAITGSIGGPSGWTISTGKISSSKSGNSTILSSVGTDAFVAGPTGAPSFIVTHSGTLNATNAIISGNISALSGTIGGFTITPSSLYGGVIKTSLNVGAGARGVIMDVAGLRGYDTVLGTTFNLPTNGDAPTFSSGIINNTIYEINTNSILRTSATVGDGTSDSAGILINNTGFYATATNQLLENANVKILIDGSATFVANIKGGQTDYDTGIGYFLGLSGGDYKFSIGSHIANFLTWDGTFLRMKGSFEVGLGGLINNSVYTVANLPVFPRESPLVGFAVPNDYI